MLFKRTLVVTSVENNVIKSITYNGYKKEMAKDLTASSAVNRIHHENWYEILLKGVYSGTVVAHKDNEESGIKGLGKISSFVRTGRKGKIISICEIDTGVVLDSVKVAKVDAEILATYAVALATRTSLIVSKDQIEHDFNLIKMGNHFMKRYSVKVK